MKDFRELAQAYRDNWVARRRDLHQHPETAFEETRTASIVADTLRGLGLEVQTGIGKTGVVGILEGQNDGPTVLVRADMDALPIHEATNHNYRSTIDGKMHACGHDGHTTIALGVAELLNAERANINGRVKFVFQPAEEIGAGADAMIQDGVLQHPAPDYCVGLHLYPLLPINHVVLQSGAFMAGASLFSVTLTGEGGHAASPHLTTDPVIAAAHIVTALQTIVSRNIDPIDAVALTVTQIIAGDAYNVVPHTATINGTFRTFLPEVQKRVVQRFREIVEHLACGMGCSAEIEILERIPPVVNDEIVTERLRNAYADMAPELTLHDNMRVTISEDMSLFLQQAPGTYMFLGCGKPEDDKAYPLHHPQFDMDEDALVLGASLIASAVSEYVYSN